MQVSPHRDGKNSNLLDSVFVYGKDFRGGRLIFGNLGVSVCADPGYSVHRRFEILDNSVSNILPLAHSNLPPLCITLSLYSHAEVYSGPVQVLAARGGGLQFSDGKMWLPFTPAGFSIDTFCNLLRKEENQWKKKYQSLVAAWEFLKKRQEGF